MFEEMSVEKAMRAVNDLPWRLCHPNGNGLVFSISSDQIDPRFHAAVQMLVKAGTLTPENGHPGRSSDLGNVIVHSQTDARSAQIVSDIIHNKMTLIERVLGSEALQLPWIPQTIGLLSPSPRDGAWIPLEGMELTPTEVDALKAAKESGIVRVLMEGRTGERVVMSSEVCEELRQQGLQGVFNLFIARSLMQRVDAAYSATKHAPWIECAIPSADSNTGVWLSEQDFQALSSNTRALLSKLVPERQKGRFDVPGYYFAVPNGDNKYNPQGVGSGGSIFAERILESLTADALSVIQELGEREVSFDHNSCHFRVAEIPQAKIQQLRSVEDSRSQFRGSVDDSGVLEFWPHISDSRLSGSDRLVNVQRTYRRALQALTDQFMRACSADVSRACADAYQYAKEKAASDIQAKTGQDKLEDDSPRIASLGKFRSLQRLPKWINEIVHEKAVEELQGCRHILQDLPWRNHQLSTLVHLSVPLPSLPPRIQTKLPQLLLAGFELGDDSLKLVGIEEDAFGIIDAQLQKIVGEVGSAGWILSESRSAPFNLGRTLQIELASASDGYNRVKAYLESVVSEFDPFAISNDGTLSFPLRFELGRRLSAFATESESCQLDFDRLRELAPLVNSQDVEVTYDRGSGYHILLPIPTHLPRARQTIESCLQRVDALDALKVDEQGAAKLEVRVVTPSRPANRSLEFHLADQVTALFEQTLERYKAEAMAVLPALPWRRDEIGIFRLDQSILNDEQSRTANRAQIAGLVTNESGGVTSDLFVQTNYWVVHPALKESALYQQLRQELRTLDE